jgi:hypothetical protein
MLSVRNPCGVATDQDSGGDFSVWDGSNLALAKVMTPIPEEGLSSVGRIVLIFGGRCKSEVGLIESVRPRGLRC